MGFVLYRPRHKTTALSPGTCSIDRRGYLSITNADADSVGLRDSAAILVDSELQRLAVRRPRDGETDVLAVRPTGSHNGRCIFVRGALRQAGLDCQHWLGRHELARKADLLIITIGVASERGGRKRR